MKLLLGFTGLNAWIDLGEAAEGHRCQQCAPTPPDVKWQQRGNTTAPIEDPLQAGPYEQALKHRPAPFVAQLRLEEQIGMLRIGVNIPTLLHRAEAQLPSKECYIPVNLAWRLTTDNTPPTFAKFQLQSNRADPPASQPPHFIRCPLRPEQLRSLHWMLEQEQATKGFFAEEEIEEAVLDPLGWRAEAKAERYVLVRGGVLADEVGYGKTAITLGLIDVSFTLPPPPAPPAPVVDGTIPIKATLIVVPGHLSKQWPSEIKKFTGNYFSVIALENLADLNKHTIAEFQTADIIVVASRIFESDKYWKNFAEFAANGPLPAKAGRRFTHRYTSALATLRKQVNTLMSGADGATQVYEAIKKGRALTDDTVIIQSKRLKAKDLRENDGAGGSSTSSPGPSLTKRNARGDD